ncbi:MAG: hypothetical protein ACW99F_15915, partial [Candidatus Hodarchaeales archaeon]
MTKSDKKSTDKKKDRTIKFDIVADKLEFYKIFLEQDHEELPSLYLKETKNNLRSPLLKDITNELVNPYIIVHFKPIDDEIYQNLSEKLKTVFTRSYPT